MGNPDTRERLRTAGPFVLDGLLAVVMAAVGLALLASALPFDPGSPRAWAAYLLVAAHTLPIAVRRRYPLPTLAWALLTGAAFAALGLNLLFGIRLFPAGVIAGAGAFAILALRELWPAA